MCAVSCATLLSVCVRMSSQAETLLLLLVLITWSGNMSGQETETWMNCNIQWKVNDIEIGIKKSAASLSGSADSWRSSSAVWAALPRWYPCRVCGDGEGDVGAHLLLSSAQQEPGDLHLESQRSGRVVRRVPPAGVRPGRLQLLIQVRLLTRAGRHA